MKKVAIITIISRNYGNRLQNYALQTVLDGMGAESETIPIEKQIPIRMFVKVIVKEILKAFNPKYRNVCWNKFDLKISWSSFLPDMTDINSAYDYFLAGSDQIWNPLFSFNSDREFLTFAEDSKKVAYAASIGIKELPERYIDVYKERLKKFRYISVREESTAEIIEKLIDKKPKIVLDPTMLLTKDQWLRVAQKQRRYSNKKYVVKYFLGECTKSTDNLIYKKSLDFKAEVIDISPNASNKKYDIGPAEFLSIIYYSKAVFTDSFHGSVFSILFHKPFLVFDRPYEEGAGKMTSRIDTLLNTFELKEQRANDVKHNVGSSLEWDYEYVDKILDKKRDESLCFLYKALNINR